MEKKISRWILEDIYETVWTECKSEGKEVFQDDTDIYDLHEKMGQWCRFLI